MAIAQAIAIDADEDLLETKMLAADLAGHVTLRDAYERRLEKLRAAKVGGSKVSHWTGPTEGLKKEER